MQLTHSFDLSAMHSRHNLCACELLNMHMSNFCYIEVSNDRAIYRSEITPCFYMNN